jgi:hypothetical protein
MGGVKECFIENGVMTTQIVNGGEILIPNNVTHIYDWEHDNREFESIIESSSIHYVRNSAYLNCVGSKISIPSSVQYVEETVFQKYNVSEY